MTSCITRPFGERLPLPHSKPLAKPIEEPAPAGITGGLREKLLLCARPARVEHVAKLHDRKDHNTPDCCEEQRAEPRMRGKQIAEMEDQVKREDVADTDDLRLRVIRAHHRLSFLQGGKQHLVGIGLRDLTWSGIHRDIRSKKAVKNRRRCLWHGCLSYDCCVASMGIVSTSGTGAPIGSSFSRMPLTAT